MVAGALGHVCRAGSIKPRKPRQPSCNHQKEVYRVSDTTNIFEQIPDNDTFGGRFSRARDAIGLSTRELAWRLGVKTATINAWETDRSQPGSRRLALLSGLLGVSLSWLLHGVGLGPMETETAESDEAFGNRLARLKTLHLETGQLILQIQGDLDRLSAVPAR
ncbi:MAG TPA: helix-turn-helix domain-containing protein [Mesorhizobium sp.]